MISTSRTLAICVPDLDLSFHWTVFLLHARTAVPAARWALQALPVASMAAQADALAGLALQPGDALFLRPLGRVQSTLLPHLQRLRGEGVHILLLGALDGFQASMLRSDHGAGLMLAAQSALRRTAPRQLLLLGRAPHFSVGAGKLADLAPQALVRDLAPCLSSLPEDVLAHGRDQLLAAHAHTPLQSGDAVLALDDQLALGALDALDAAGLTGQVHVSGSGATPAGLLAMQEGRMQASLYFDAAVWLRRALDWAETPERAFDERVPPGIVEAGGLAAFHQQHGEPYMQVLEQAVRQLRTTRQAADFMETVMENMPAMLFVKRMPDLRYHMINKAREQFIGRPRDQVLGRTSYDFYSKEDADRYTARDIEVVESGAIVDQPVLRIDSPDGRERYVLTRKIPLMGANGQPAWLVGISMDVTDRQLAEQDLARRKGELEQAHAALKENQHKLLVSEKMAALGRLTAGIAHEMNTPLAAIRAAMAELTALTDELAASVGDDSVTADDFREMAAEMRHSAQLASKSAERAASFVRSVKHHTRNHGRDEKVAFDAVQVTQESILLLDHLIKRRHCQVTLDLPPGRMELLGPPGGFSQVITNLVSNALDACADDGSGRIKVQLRVEADADALQASVSDNGSGIDADNLSRIFDPMFTTKAFGHGTGLGLAIVHEIVHDQFGGHIDVRSAPQQSTDPGTVFTLRFPLLH